MKLEELFAEERQRGIDIFFGGRESVEYIKPTQREIGEIEKCLNIAQSRLAKVSPTLAAEFANQKSLFIKFGGIAKALWPGTKPISFPSQTGHIGVNVLIPAFIKYYATASSTYPCYTDYTANSWNISLTAGTAAYLFGDGTNYYKASPTDEKHELIVIMQNGVVEIGSTPKIDQMRIITQAETKYGIWTVHPLIDVPIEQGKAIYQYNTIGAVPIFHDFGIMWKVMPTVSGTSTLKLIGIAYYEHDFASDTLYIS